MICEPTRSILGFLVNSETGHSEDQQPNLRHALGSVKRVKVRLLGFLVNSETGHSEELQPNLRHEWAHLLTVKRDTEKNCNQISEAQELKRSELEQPVLREPTLKEWGAAGAPLIPRSVDSRPPRQVAC